MSDQADALRRIVRERNGLGLHAGPGSSAVAPAEAPTASASAGGLRSRPARSLVLTSGKGGVGTSNLALNLAVALAELGRGVILVDGDLGLANLDLLCGLAPAADLGDVLGGPEDGRFSPALADGPAGVRLLAGAHGLRTGPDVLDDAPARLAAGLAELEHAADLLLIDAGSGLGPAAATLAAAADEVAVVTTPEPTSLADAHAALGRLKRLPGVRLRVLVNQARSAAEARDVLDRLTLSTRQFLGASVEPLGPGHVRFDPRVPAAVRARTPFVLAAPNGPAARGVRRLARAWLAELDAERPPIHGRDPGRRPGFFTALAARVALRRVAR